MIPRKACAQQFWAGAADEDLEAGLLVADMQLQGAQDGDRVVLLCISPWLASSICLVHVRMYCIPIGAVTISSEYFGHDGAEGLVVIGHGPSINAFVLPDIDAAVEEFIQTVAAAVVVPECG
eukprot:9075479-Pyramimonas_sp.AAC.1